MADRAEVPWSVPCLSTSVSWSPTTMPAGLDLIRLLSLSVPLSDAIPALLEVAHSTTGSVKEQETNTLLAFRALANTFVTPAGKSLMKDEAAEVSSSLPPLSRPLTVVICCRLSSCWCDEDSSESARMGKLHWLRSPSSSFSLHSSSHRFAHIRLATLFSLSLVMSKPLLDRSCLISLSR